MYISRRTTPTASLLCLLTLVLWATSEHLGAATPEDSWEKVIPIVLTPDDNYAPHAGVAMISILEHSNPHYLYWFSIIHSKDLSESNKSKLASIAHLYPNCKISLIERVPQADQLTTDLGLWGETATYRLFLAEIPEFSSVQKVIYLDCDVIALSDISEFYDIPMNGCAVLGLKDVKQTWHVNRLNRLSNKSKRLINKRPGHPTPKLTEYSSSGVLLINLEALRKLHFSRQAILWMNKHKPTFPDQDTFNLLLLGNIEVIQDLQWAYPAYAAQEDKRALKASTPIKLYHYAGPYKPWMIPLPEKEEAIKNLSEYHHYRMLSPWKYEETSGHPTHNEELLNTTF